MALYFVTMDINARTADPRMPVDRLANIVREAILPSVKALIPLRAQGKLVTGGYLVGERSMVFVFEADSGKCGPWENCTLSRSSSGALARRTAR